MSLHEHWEPHAHAWADWVRTRDDDAYWLLRDAFFAEIVPPPGEATLDVGCGEGRVARDLRDRGHRVTGVDRAPTMVALAAAADPGSTYLAADAAALPFPDGSFDLAVSYNVLMNLDDLEGGVRELARVLRPGGRAAICVIHPLAYVYRREGGRFRLDGSYYEREDVRATYTRDGVTMTFVDRPRTLETYVAALAGAGLLVERLREVTDDEPAVRPQFMFLRALKPAP